MRKSLSILAISLVSIIALSMSTSAISLTPNYEPASASDGTLIVSVFYKNGSSCDNATIEMTKNGGGYSRVEHTNELGDSITIEGVPEGNYTILAYRPHPTGGKSVGILMWGKAINNQYAVVGGQDNTLTLNLVGGLGKSVQYKTERPIFSLIKMLLLRL